LVERPALVFALGLCAAGLLYCAGLVRLVRASLALDAARSSNVLGLLFSAGLAARLVLFGSVPVLEDDFYRYLWDGAVTAAGGDPYARAPADVAAGPTDGLGFVVGPDAARVLDRIGHAELSTIYPPVAQAAFALAHLIEPWSLAAWRLVLLACDLATFGLLLLLLDRAGRSRLWSALYWWNPLVVATLYNGAHMDVVVLPPLLLALLSACRGGAVRAAACLAVAAGAKVWPVLLLPLILRPVLHDARRLALAAAAFTGIVGVLALPVFLSGLGEASGFTAYAQGWQRNSALFPMLSGLVAGALGGVGMPVDLAGLVTRGLLAALCAAIAVAVAIRPLAGAEDLMRRAGLVVASLLLLAPAQYPWYFVWLAPFLAFQPRTGLMLMTATLPLYYSAFYLLPRDEIGVFDRLVVWIVWVPVWVMLARDALGSRRGRPAG
jgi:hypothetical protein